MDSKPSIYLPYITGDAEYLIAEYRPIYIYSAFVGRMISMIIDMEFSAEDKFFLSQTAGVLAR